MGPRRWACCCRRDGPPDRLSNRAHADKTGRDAGRLVHTLQRCSGWAVVGTDLSPVRNAWRWTSTTLLDWRGGSYGEVQFVAGEMPQVTLRYRIVADATRAPSSGALLVSRLGLMKLSTGRAYLRSRPAGALAGFVEGIEELQDGPLVGGREVGDLLQMLE